MAFPLSNNQRDIANRKLLEDLHLKKQILLKQDLTITNRRSYRMKPKQLEYQLSSLKPFRNPKILLEQYVNPPHIAAYMLHYIESEYEDIGGHMVADLGCGAGCLSIGTALLDAAVVYGFEKDSDALEVFQENVEEFEVPQIETVQCDVRRIPNRFEKSFDTVIMNPPFGTKRNAGIDMEFLEIGVKLANNAVYSLHKSSTSVDILLDKKGQKY